MSSEGSGKPNTTINYAASVTSQLDRGRPSGPITTNTGATEGLKFHEPLEGEILVMNTNPLGVLFQQNPDDRIAKLRAESAA